MKHEFIMPFICKWEGGLSNDKNDSASANPCPVSHNGTSDWHTNMGIIWPVWVRYCLAKGVKIEAIQADRFFKMTKADQSDVFKTLYWDAVKGDDYNHTAIANCMASWAWGSGQGGALKQIQAFIKKKAMGVPKTWDEVPTTLARLPIKQTFDDLCEARKNFFISISGEGTKNAKFRKGWLNRLEAFKKYNEPLLK